MSVHMIFMKDGAKMMRPILTREEYLAQRDGGDQKPYLKRIRAGEEKLKNQLVQMNYSCLPNEDGSLKGSKRLSTTVGMDIDFVAPKDLSAEEQRAWLSERMAEVPELVMSKKDELGLKMFEQSATKGYHLVFARRPELSQEENLKWASELLGVKFDDNAKDITRVFFTTTSEQLIYLDDRIFEIEEAEEVLGTDYADLHGLSSAAEDKLGTNFTNSHEIISIRDNSRNSCQEKDYNGIPYSEIIKKYWELFNGGKEPVEGDRNALTFELAVTLRSICGYSIETLQQVIPNYWAKSDGTCSKEDLTEWNNTLMNALKEPKKGMPYRLRQVMNALKETNRVKACGGTMTSPPPMSKRLPPLIKLLTKNVPWMYKPAVASAVFPALGAHLHGVKFRYWDNVLHEATFMNLLVGRQSVGKGSI